MVVVDRRRERKVCWKAQSGVKVLIQFKRGTEGFVCEQGCDKTRDRNDKRRNPAPLSKFTTALCALTRDRRLLETSISVRHYDIKSHELVIHPPADLPLFPTIAHLSLAQATSATAAHSKTSRICKLPNLLPPPNSLNLRKVPISLPHHTKHSDPSDQRDVCSAHSNKKETPKSKSNSNADDERGVLPAMYPAFYRSQTPTNMIYHRRHRRPLPTGDDAETLNIHPLFVTL